MIGSILIVDDEPLIRKGLTRLIETNDLGWRVAGEAGNGQEALAQLEHLKPDLVLSDIRMPLMDGLELTRYISERCRDTAVIILTGYRDFEYAQAALRYGVEEFLLKPCPEDEIFRVLRQAYEQLRRKAEQRQREERERRDREDHALRSTLLGLPQPAGEPPQAMEWLQGRDFWLVSVETFQPEGKLYLAEDMDLLQFAVSNIAAELMASRGRGRWMTVEYGRLAFFLEPGDGDAAFFSHLCGTVLRLLGLHLTALRLGTVKMEGDAERLFKMHGAASSLRHASDRKNERIDEARVRAIHAEITSLLLLGKHSELGAFLRQSFKGMPPDSLAQRKTDALCLAMVIREVLRKEFDAEPEAGDIGSELRELRLLPSYAAVDAWVSERIAALERTAAQWLEERNSGLAERAIRYMEQHYMEECSLAAVSAHVHLNPNYFSNLFKKQTGESFSVYLARLRADKAKMLLTNTDMKITEIAEAVGYADSNYFATAFKQAVGRTPSEYRKLHRL
ncbi:Protein-glutamate methylesterase/protein-glutamine glutaminase [Paenibacillus solanacearum]|uniref:Protein-glutamate methylesterase/protein-glutamine glutaminase n=1 Tax=Paenibacillus solanacearum TaxID=2048548 RepID=A0A916JYW4_9BACL|nr:response regulator [Paenibacillus solanacearum]CAG7608726.1 Protein-glutamate methylesterase/protein-glutamine glutaminase [Paenibacillus solanacearum]